MSGECHRRLNDDYAFSFNSDFYSVYAVCFPGRLHHSGVFLWKVNFSSPRNAGARTKSHPIFYHGERS